MTTSCHRASRSGTPGSLGPGGDSGRWPPLASPSAALALPPGSSRGCWEYESSPGGPGRTGRVRAGCLGPPPRGWRRGPPPSGKTTTGRLLAALYVGLIHSFMVKRRNRPLNRPAGESFILWGLIIKIWSESMTLYTMDLKRYLLHWGGLLTDLLSSSEWEQKDGKWLTDCIYVALF